MSKLLKVATTLDDSWITYSLSCNSEAQFFWSKDCCWESGLMFNPGLIGNGIMLHQVWALLCISTGLTGRRSCYCIFHGVMDPWCILKTGGGRHFSFLSIHCHLRWILSNAICNTKCILWHQPQLLCRAGKVVHKAVPLKPLLQSWFND